MFHTLRCISHAISCLAESNNNGLGALRQSRAWSTVRKLVSAVDQLGRGGAQQLPVRISVDVVDRMKLGKALSDGLSYAIASENLGCIWLELHWSAKSWFRLGVLLKDDDVLGLSSVNPQRNRSGKTSDSCANYGNVEDFGVFILCHDVGLRWRMRRVVGFGSRIGTQTAAIRDEIGTNGSG